MPRLHRNAVAWRSWTAPPGSRGLRAADAGDVQRHDADRTTAIDVADSGRMRQIDREIPNG
jgi:hypothetical protein